LGQGLAVIPALRRLGLAAAVLALVAACGSEAREPSPIGVAIGTMAKATVGRVLNRGGGDGAAAAAPVTRADLEALGTPILRATITGLGADTVLVPTDAKGGIVTWSNGQGGTLTLRDGVLIQTRGLGPDLMSAEAPQAAQLLVPGGTHPRVYYFLGADDQTTRRSYDCTVTIDGAETIQIFGRDHAVTKLSEACSRPQGTITNTYWVEGETIRKSRQLASGGLGFIEFERVVD
jgi:hypothetical protein